MLNNNRGQIGIILFFSVLLIVIIGGFIAAMSWTVIDFASDELTPVMEGLGMAGDVNVSEISEYTFGTMDTVVQAMPWMISMAYILCLVFTIVFIFIAGYQPHPAFIGLYFALMVLLIFGCVIMSNMYQYVYLGSNDIALRLQEQTTMSYLILHSPFIMAMIAVIGGIMMFGMQTANKQGYGGYGG